MGDEPDKAEWRMTEVTVPERPNDGDWREMVGRLLLVLLVVVALLIVFFPWLVWASFYYRTPPGYGS